MSFPLASADPTTTGITILDVISLISGIASLVLAVIAIWLSFAFFKLSSAASKSTDEAAKGISASVERLEKLFDKLYSDTFSMMRETVTDMRKHIWKAPITEDANEVEEVGDGLRKEIANQINTILESRDIGPADTKAIKEDLEQSIERMLKAREGHSNEAGDRRLVKLVGALGQVRVDRLIELLEDTGYDVPLGLFRLRREGLVTWSGLKDAISSDSVVSLRANDKSIFTESELRRSITAIVEKCRDQAGWTFLGTIGLHLKKQFGDVDYTQFGYSSLYRFLQEDKQLEFDERGEGSGNLIYVRMRDAQGFKQDNTNDPTNSNKSEASGKAEGLK